jgi:hypothetical protein
VSKTFFLSTFFGVSRQGEFKNTIKIFWQKVRAKTFPKISTKISMSVFRRVFLFYRIFGCFFSDGSSKTLQKTFYKKIVSKSFYKKFDQKSKTDFFSKSFYHVFGRFWLRGGQKHDEKYIEKINPTLVLFGRPLVTDFFYIGGSSKGGVRRTTQDAPPQMTQRASWLCLYVVGQETHTTNFLNFDQIFTVALTLDGVEVMQPGRWIFASPATSGGRGATCSRGSRGSR